MSITWSYSHHRSTGLNKDEMLTFGQFVSEGRVSKDLKTMLGLHDRIKDHQARQIGASETAEHDYAKQLDTLLTQTSEYVDAIRSKTWAKFTMAREIKSMDAALDRAEKHLTAGDAKSRDRALGEIHNVIAQLFTLSRKGLDEAAYATSTGSAHFGFIKPDGTDVKGKVSHSLLAAKLGFDTVSQAVVKGNLVRYAIDRDGNASFEGLENSRTKRTMTDAIRAMTDIVGEIVVEFWIKEGGRMRLDKRDFENADQALHRL